jgi:chromosome segregation ATPase
VPDTADTTQAAGQPDASTDDAAAQQMLAQAVQQQPSAQASSGTQDDPAGQQPSATSDPWSDPDVARKEIEKLRRESAGWRTKYREAEPQLTEYQKWQDAQKTEQQKLTEAKEAAERELGDLRSTNARLMAAATHNIPPELIDLLGSGTDDEINARAEILAERLKVTAPTSAPASQRPVESLTPGAAPSSAAPTDPDAWIRKLAGR